VSADEERHQLRGQSLLMEKEHKNISHQNISGYNNLIRKCTQLLCSSLTELSSSCVAVFSCGQPQAPNRPPPPPPPPLVLQLVHAATSSYLRLATSR